MLISEKGNLAVVGDILSIAGRTNRISAGGRAIERIVREVVDCARDPVCREIVRDFVRDFVVERVVEHVVERIVDHFDR